MPSNTRVAALDRMRGLVMVLMAVDHASVFYYVLCEGGGLLQLGESRVLYSVELAQKAPLWLRITAEGVPGHASSPSPAAASHTLVRALSRLEAHRFPFVVLPEVQAVFTARAQAAPEPLKSKLLVLQKSLSDPSFQAEFLANPHDAALVRNTLSITMLAGSDKENVLSPSASAVLDLRLLPGQDPAAVRAEVIRVMDEPSVKVETLLSWQSTPSRRDTPLFTAIEQLAAERDPGASVAANVIGGFTDCNAFRLAGFTCYGFVPLRFSFDDLKGMHGNDERLSLPALVGAVQDQAALVQGLLLKR